MRAVPHRDSAGPWGTRGLGPFFVLLLGLGLSSGLSGCVRIEFDLCDDDPPHPDCIDAGSRARTDAGASRDAEAGELDAGGLGGQHDASQLDAEGPDAGEVPSEEDPESRSDASVDSPDAG